MCMHIMVVRCLSTSIAIIQEHSPFPLPSFYHPPPFFSLFLYSFPSYLCPSSPSCPLLYLPSFYSTPPSFPTLSFLPTSLFPPISSSLIPPLLSFRSFLFLLASSPSNPLFRSHSSNNSTPSFSTPSSFPTPQFLPISLFYPIHPILSFHPTPPLFPIPPSLPFLPTPLFIPIPTYKSPRYFITFLSKNSTGVSQYPIRIPKWQPPAHRHTYITSTSRYQLAVLLNSINYTHDMMRNGNEHIAIRSLLIFKATIKPYLNNNYSYYCSIKNLLYFLQTISPVTY